ncbi:MAG: arginyl-tRNA--protein arginylyltransferase [Cyclobacteriaceae bacterium]|nr:arginyl-tRNA--protein arginylyltransferase [Cyclobacteriaceae bacterium]
MFAQVQQPEQLAPHELDEYLARGWFRMGQTIFTTNFVHFNDTFYSAIWLRLRLTEFESGSTQLKLFKRNARFRTEIKPATITSEKEELYAHYKESLAFEPSASLMQLLYRGTNLPSVYNTYEVAVYDQNHLIAIGYFDLGATAAEGITSVYHPDYKKYSLGKYLIYQKINYCKQLGLTYFYPGYFVPGYPYFDYKLSIGKNALEFLQLNSRQWLPIQSFSPACIPIMVMEEKLVLLQKLLAEKNIISSVLKYEYFDANLVPELRDAELFDFPVILLFESSVDDHSNPMVVFDPQDGCYHLITFSPVWLTGSTSISTSIFSSHVLKMDQEICHTPDATVILDLVSNHFQSTTK